MPTTTITKVPGAIPQKEETETGQALDLDFELDIRVSKSITLPPIPTLGASTSPCSCGGGSCGGTCYPCYDTVDSTCEGCGPTWHLSCICG
jgi:hypothetical protein